MERPGFVADSECQGLGRTAGLRGGGVCRTGDQSVLPVYSVGGRYNLSSWPFGVCLLPQEPVSPPSSVSGRPSMCLLCNWLQEPRGFCFSA